jgi:hypothetical protein
LNRVRELQLRERRRARCPVRQEAYRQQVDQELLELVRRVVARVRPVERRPVGQAPD